MLRIDDLVFRIAGRVLFERASLVVPAGHKVGLVGRNGSGKTTLLRLIAGEAQADGGVIQVAKGARLGRVAQEAPGGPRNLLDTVLEADGERLALLAEAETSTDGGRLAEIHERLNDIGSHAAPARASSILAGLGFDEAAQGRPCGEFSGGWRMRVALAAALFSRPDLLLLDEPTNHLDLEAAMWLANHLAGWSGTLIVISHDRRMLNRVVEGIVHLHQRRLTRYAGNYDRFERTRRERQQRETRLHARQQAERRRIAAFVERFRYKATKARQAQSRIKMLARMEPIATVIEERTPSFAFPAPAPLPPPIVAMEGVAVGYGENPPVLSDLNLRIDMDDRIALIGANGNGKSTLIKLLAGRLAPRAGRLHRPGALRCGYFAQHQADELDPGATAFEHLARIMDQAAPAKVRAHLGRFGFAGDKADVVANELSGGEKSRLLFALMSVGSPHIVLLDEPTNHLDVDAREALVQALNEYGGALIVVSHDAHLIDFVCDRLWLVAEGTCAPFEGDLEDYRKLLEDQRRQVRRNDRQPARPGRKDLRRARAAARAGTATLRKAARDAEKRLESLNARKRDLEARLADPEVYGGPTARLMELQIELAQIKSAIAETEQAWLEAHDTLETGGS